MCRYNSTSKQYESRQVVLSPSQTSVILGREATVKTVGDFLPTQYPSHYENSMLLTPSSPDSDSKVISAKNGDSTFSLLVQREQVSITGLECDKIGTSYQAFLQQPNACESPVNSCLSQQIRDLFDSDAAINRTG